jgi:hypothetical protein
MAFGKKPLSIADVRKVPVVELKKLSVDKLANLGRFNLRMLAYMVGIKHESKEFEKYGSMANAEQAIYLHPKLRDLVPSPDELLIAEMNEAAIVEKYRYTCGDFAKLLRTMRKP